MWHTYCYIVLSRASISMHSLFDSNLVYTWDEHRCEPSLLKQKTHKCYLCEIDSAPSEEKWLERAQNYFNKKTLLVYAVFTGNSNIFVV